MPVCFLLNFSFDQLKMAVMNLKKQANKKNEGSLAYVKGGLSTFFEAQDALSGKLTNDCMKEVIYTCRNLIKKKCFLLKNWF